MMLYITCALLVIYYDTIYAMQDKEDDKAIGVKSITLLGTFKNVLQGMNVLLVIVLCLYAYCLWVKKPIIFAVVYTFFVIILLILQQRLYLPRKDFLGFFNSAKVIFGFMAIGLYG
jgi:4-hydroxybenzoate polyprenyltransferase